MERENRERLEKERQAKEAAEKNKNMKSEKSSDRMKTAKDEKAPPKHKEPTKEASMGKSDKVFIVLCHVFILYFKLIAPPPTFYPDPAHDKFLLTFLQLPPHSIKLNAPL